MLGLHVTVPIACFRKGLAREYLETEALPPPATCYGFLLSLVGEIDRRRHVGCRVTAGLVGKTSTSVVLRTVWRVKEKGVAQGSGTNARPDYQQLLSGASRKYPFIDLIVWLDSTHEVAPGEPLETRVSTALNPASRGAISRFGGLSLGESTHLVDSISRLDDARRQQLATQPLQLFEARHDGSMTLPVWVDHVGSRGTRYVTGSLITRDLGYTPPIELLPLIAAE